NGIAGEVSGQQAASTSFRLNSGNNQTQQAHVPLAPTFDNPANYYSKLHFVINPSNNPSDTKFAIAISSDSFATTRYIQNDGTVGSTLGIEDYQIYGSTGVGWGGASGSLVIGLESSMTYQIKAKAISGKFTETGFGPLASATTSPPSLFFDIDVSASDTETGSPYQMSFGSLLSGTVIDGPQKIWFDLDTNAEYGARIYVSGNTAGLTSQSASNTIISATADLSAAPEGYGAQSSSAAQTSGGPLTAASPYDGAGSNIGIMNTTLRQFYSSPGPISSGRSSLLLKAKAGVQTPSADDYQSIMTAIAAASF
ncbi:MAG TPA: hypothetical protein VF272_00155, partial [Candidatus Saccharimonadia bacterium]